MRYQPEIYTYSHYQQRKKKNQKERNSYYYYYNSFNPEGTDHLLLTGDILTSYQHLTLKKQQPWHKNSCLLDV